MTHSISWLMTILGTPMPAAAVLLLIIGPLVGSSAIYMRLIPLEQRTHDGPDKLKIALCVPCWLAAGLIIDAVY